MKLIESILNKMVEVCKPQKKFLLIPGFSEYRWQDDVQQHVSLYWTE